MGKKPQRHSWPEAKKLCRLNQLDIEMAKRLGFGPDALIRSRPDPKQKWKLPVKYWVRELYEKRFGHVLGEKPVAAAVPIEPEYDEEEQRRFEEEMYWEDYWDRNSDSLPSSSRKDRARQASGKLQEQPEETSSVGVDPSWKPEEIVTDEDVPF